MPALIDVCRRLEHAQAAQNRAVAEAQARATPGLGAEGRSLGGGQVVYLGPGHMLNQALALGLDGPVGPEVLDEIEALLGQGGHPVVVELTPAADPGLASLLAARGYRIRQFMQVWWRPIDVADGLAASSLEVRAIRPGEETLFARVVSAGFMEQDTATDDEAAMILPTTAAAGTTCFLAFQDGQAIGAGTVGIHDHVATLSGTSVRPAHRGSGAQAALIRARVAHGRAHGCELAASCTLPMTPSQRNLVRLGFEVAYPKLELELERLPG